MGVKSRLPWLVLPLAYVCLSWQAWLGGKCWLGYGLTSIALLGALLWWENDDIPFSTKTVFGVGILCRCLVFLLPPVLSPDVFRYLWDGYLQTQGVNPFQYAPSDPALARFHDLPLYMRVDSLRYYSVYPPVSQELFRFAAWLGDAAVHPVRASYVLKVAMAFAEGFVFWVIVKSNRSQRWLILYAWNPLVIMETWGQAHSEALALGLLGLAFVAWKRHQNGAAIAVCLAGWVKLYPLLFLPLLLRKDKGAFLRVGILVCLSVLLWWPYARGDTWSHFKESVDLYVTSFDFNAMPYYLVNAVTRKCFGFWAAGMMRWLGLGLVAWVCWQHWRVGGDWAAAALLIMLICLVTTTTLHPWYFLLPLVLSQLSGRRLSLPWQWLAVASSLTYTFYTIPQVRWLVLGVIWVPWFLGHVRAAAKSRFERGWWRCDGR